MDIAHHQSVPRPTTSQKKSHKGKRKDDEPLKVVYISSPMKVRTSASRFRSLVQELTGKDSDIARYMDADRPTSEFHDHDELLAKEAAGANQVVSSISSDEMTTTTTTTTPTTSDSFLGTTDNVFTSHLEDRFAGIFSSFSDPSQLDVLGSYDDLI